MTPKDNRTGLIHDIYSPGLRDQNIENIGIMYLSVGDSDKRRYITAQIQSSMEFDGAFGFSEPRPGKNRQAQVNC
ncbi:MAG: hypothetical protein KGY56_14225 [Desulfobacterales bacterium]|nr:hypothetical protein [Desulfobacterales bacterium]